MAEQMCEREIQVSVSPRSGHCVWAAQTSGLDRTWAGKSRIADVGFVCETDVSQDVRWGSTGRRGEANDV